MAAQQSAYRRVPAARGRLTRARNDEGAARTGSAAARACQHSLAGCFFYGAFAAKVLVQSRRLPGWVLPVAGGALAVVVGVLWYTSALWYYNGFQLPAL